MSSMRRVACFKYNQFCSEVAPVMNMLDDFPPNNKAAAVALLSAERN